MTFIFYILRISPFSFIKTIRSFSNLPSPGTRERGAALARRGEGSFRDSSFVIRACSLSLIFFGILVLK